MIEGPATAVAVLAGALGAWALLLAALDRLPPKIHLQALFLLQAALVLQAVVAVVRMSEWAGSKAELSGYLPPGPRKTGWGMIACQMVENYRVENCRALGQSPGSGLSRAVLNAAWQFRVRPPSIGGRPIMGAWVRIRIEFSEGGVE